MDTGPWGGDAMRLRNPHPQQANSGKYEQRKISKSYHLDLKFRFFSLRNITHLGFQNITLNSFYNDYGGLGYTS